MRKIINGYEISSLEMFEIEKYMGLCGFKVPNGVNLFIYDGKDKSPCGIFEEPGIVVKFNSRLEEELDKLLE